MDGGDSERMDGGVVGEEEDCECVLRMLALCSGFWGIR